MTPLGEQHGIAQKEEEKREGKGREAGTTA
ncbi:hypothetical protein EES40_11195 [Streptomyces sp. ADI93-02]|nr:hypothetical protein EES40_11195 [Streptomyces sp. ADI93-02]